MLSLWILDPLVSTEVKWQMKKKLQIWDQVQHLYGQILQKQQKWNKLHMKGTWNIWIVLLYIVY